MTFSTLGKVCAAFRNVTRDSTLDMVEVKVIKSCTNDWKEFWRVGRDHHVGDVLHALLGCQILR